MSEGNNNESADAQEAQLMMQSLQVRYPKTTNAYFRHINARANDGEVSGQLVAAALPIGLMYAMDEDVQGVEYALPAIAPILSVLANWAERKAVEDTRKPSRFPEELTEDERKMLATSLGWKEGSEVPFLGRNLSNVLAGFTLVAPYLAKLAQKQ